MQFSGMEWEETGRENCFVHLLAVHMIGCGHMTTPSLLGHSLVAAGLERIIDVPCVTCCQHLLSHILEAFSANWKCNKRLRMPSYPDTHNMAYHHRTTHAPSNFDPSKGRRVGTGARGGASYRRRVDGLFRY